MTYTVSQLAELSGVSNRTLRYYDQIGLLKPARINESGYRIYEQEEVDTLQQIVFYRELEISLDEIKEIIQQPTFNRMKALENHYYNLKQQRERLDKIIQTVKKTIANNKGEIIMQDREKFEGFKEKAIKENETKYGREIRMQYGDDLIDQSNKKFKDMTQADYDAWKDLEKEIIDLLSEAYQTGNPASELAQLLAAKHKDWLMYTWPEYSKEAHAGLAEMYVNDATFTDYYDKHVEGGTQFLKDAILVFVDEV
ncbi:MULTISPECIES: MerR family transcriptional regulator [Staphylococcus]|uniref:MerR family transcriptional regulator n=1 Tax=Staphylococcus xylosus TaxID=1288 RepID=A0A418ILF6_STAXY|nr:MULTISPECIES: MerR family transcriptional regulator [Staphylococcus]MDW8543522.1 MerR family transcriptional regulator [Staphylococcus sp. KG4-1]MDW8562949.1 MerR family transcriptional regulator [Staphylococcus sp. KG4-3]NQD97857.1 MerR family transcriptional regulator [Staphylococcus xylosus]PTI04487.1 MerR family transcriptional regulator [Staphylococcus xylosus]RIN08773.1 MerR family transcriptional regulator [Staphylococcus xylosus]